jgi:hypothetical protein
MTTAAPRVVGVPTIESRSSARSDFQQSFAKRVDRFESLRAEKMSMPQRELLCLTLDFRRLSLRFNGCFHPLHFQAVREQRP